METGAAGAVGLVEEDELLVRSASLTAVLDWPAEAEQAVLTDAPEQCALGGGVLGWSVGHERAEVLPQFAAEPQLASGRGEVHARASRLHIDEWN